MPTLYSRGERWRNIKFFLEIQLDTIANFRISVGHIQGQTLIRGCSPQGKIVSPGH